MNPSSGRIGRQSRASLSPWGDLQFQGDLSNYNDSERHGTQSRPSHTKDPKLHPTLCFGLICDVSRRQGPTGIAEGLLPGRAHLTSPLRCRCLPWGGEPWRSLEPTPGIMLSDGSHPNRCGLAQGGSCHSRQKAAPGPQKPLCWGLFWCSHVPPKK